MQICILGFKGSHAADDTYAEVLEPADDETCDALVRMFDPYNPKVIRVDVEPELRSRLEAVERRLQRVEPNESMPTGL